MDAISGVLLITLILPPFLLSVIVFNYLFPRNTIKLPATFLVPLALVMALGTNFPVILLSIKTTIAECMPLGFIPLRIIEACLENPWLLAWNILLYLVFCAWPATLTFLITNHLRTRWIQHRRIAYRQNLFKKFWRKPKAALPFSIHANIVEQFILHHFAKLSLYDPRLEELMVDVRTNDGFLFSGKFGRYYLDGKDFAGVSMHNVIKFDTRKPDEEPRYYLVPNNGEIHFPSSSVADIHFWKLKRRSVAYFKLIDLKSTTRLAWVASLQYAMPKMRLRIVAKLPVEINQRIFDKLKNELARCGLKPRDVKIEFQKAT